MNNEKNQMIIDQFKRKRSNYENMRNEELKKLVNYYKSDYEDVDEISEETIASLFSNDQRDNDTKETNKILNKILEYQHGIKKIDYILNRNTYTDGELDTALSISELTSTKEQAKQECIQMGIEKIRESSHTISSIYRSLKEQNADFKIRYEIQKQFMCNKYGYTPESFDEYFNAIKEHNSKIYNEKGSNVIKGAFVHSNNINEEFKHLLKKKDNWDGEEVVYKSEFLEKYKKEYDKVESERPRNTEGARLYNSFLEMNKNIILQNMPGYKSNDSVSSTRIGEEVKDNNKKSLREERLKRRLQKHKTEEPKEEYKPETVVLKEKDVNYDNLFESTQTKEEDKSNIEDAVVLTGETDLNSNIVTSEPIMVEIVSKTTDVIKNPDIIQPKIVEEEVKEIENFEEVFPKVEQKADISILRSNKPDKLKLYNESYKYGRILYLPYSGYEVLVKRIVDRAQLSYVLELLQTSKLSSDMTVELEIMRVIYNNLEFFFDEDPTEIDFYKNLSIRDIPIIITTMALISQKEDDKGDVWVEIDRVICLNEKCQKRISTDKPITINLKSKFQEIYPIELYYTNYHLYKEANYSNIYQAYVNSIDGKVKTFTYSEEGLEYKCIYGKTTFYNSSESMTKKENELAYQLFKDDLSNMTEDEIEKEFPLLDVKDYIKDKYLIQLQLRYEEILSEYPDIDEEYKIEDNKRTEEELDIIDEYKHLKAIISKLNDNLDEMRNILSVIANIRNLKVVIKDTNEVVINSSTKDLYELFNTVISLPQEFYKLILNDYVDQQNEMSNYDYKKTFIKISSNTLKGNIKITSVLKSREDFEKYIGSKYKDEEVQKEWLEVYNKSVDNLSNGLCTCGHDEFYINHFNLLFFSITKQLGVKTNQD